MNYKEKVAQQIHDHIAQMEADLVKTVTGLIVESFKNGLDAGKQRGNRSKGKPRDKGREQSAPNEGEGE